MGSTRKSFFSNFDEPRFKPKPKTNTFTAEFHVTRMYFQVHVLLNPYKESDLFSFFGFNVNLLILLCSNWATASIIKTQNFYRFLKEFFCFSLFLFLFGYFCEKVLVFTVRFVRKRDKRERERERLRKTEEDEELCLGSQFLHWERWRRSGSWKGIR